MRGYKLKAYKSVEDLFEANDEHYIFIDALGRQNDILMSQCEDNLSIDYTHLIDGIEYDGGQLESITYPQLLVSILMKSNLIRIIKSTYETEV